MYYFFLTIIFKNSLLHLLTGQERSLGYCDNLFGEAVWGFNMYLSRSIRHDIKDLLVVILKCICEKLKEYFLSVIFWFLPTGILDWYHETHGLIAHADKTVSHCKIFHFGV